MPLARRPGNRIRVIAHVDLDCFYVQVEQRRQPNLRGKPTVVIQYNSWKGGGCIAVGYEARKFGVKRSMRGDAAKAVCPDLNLVQVPVLHEKADLSIYRDAGSEVVSVLSRVGKCERASIDEVYLDITDAAEKLFESRDDFLTLVTEEALKSHIVGVSEDATREWLCRRDASREDLLLACGAVIVADIRSKVLAETEFTCSAGVAHNKMLAKLSSGMHKPAQQTLVPTSSVESLLASLPISKIGKLGGKLGQELEEDLGAKMVGDLLQFSEVRLQDMYGPNTGSWLWNTARGINGDEVQDRTLPKSHSSGKTFPGPRALKTLDSVVHWLKELAETLQLRLDEDLSQNNRIAHHLTLHASCHIKGRASGTQKFSSKSRPLRYGVEKIVDDSQWLFERSLHEFCSNQSSGKEQSTSSSSWAVTGLSLTASNIMAKPAGVNPITQYFGTQFPNKADTTSCQVKAEEKPDNSTPGDGVVPHSVSPQRLGKLAELWKRKSSIQQEREEKEENEEGLGDNSEEKASASVVGAPNSASPFPSRKPGKLAELWQRKSSTQREREEAEVLEVKATASGFTDSSISDTTSSKKPGKLAELWRRKSSAQRESKADEAAGWDYKEEEIDQSVLSELPPEIQLELQGRLESNRKRHKQGTIAEIFGARKTM